MVSFVTKYKFLKIRVADLNAIVLLWCTVSTHHGYHHNVVLINLLIIITMCVISISCCAVAFHLI